MRRLSALLWFGLAPLWMAAQVGPTMGWSSWNTFGLQVSESLMCEQGDALISTGLRRVGYDHINLDDGFFGGRDMETGELLIHPQRFPNGLRPMVDYLHRRGLKAGIYSDAGANTCGNYWGGDTIAVNVGLYRFDQRDIDFYFLDCGFDFIKVDYCGASAKDNRDRLDLDPRERYTAIAEALRHTGRRDVRMNVCRWNYPGNWVNDVAFSWRTTGDIYDAWQSVKDILAENLYMSAYCRDGHYNDMDMLEVGRSLTDDEDKTHFGMWCIMASPLLIGCDLRTIKPATLSLLKNTELIALNQDRLHQQAYLCDFQQGCYVLAKDLKKQFGKTRAVAVYNPTDTVQRVVVRFDRIDLGGRIRVRDLFTHSMVGRLTDSLTVEVPAHGTRIYRLRGDKRLERRRYEAETAYISNYQELVNPLVAGNGTYESDPSCSGGFRVAHLGGSEDNDLVWRDVYSKKGGDYLLTIKTGVGANGKVNVQIGSQTSTTSVLAESAVVQGATITFRVHLPKGCSRIRLFNADGPMPDIDYIELQKI